MDKKRAFDIISKFIYDSSMGVEMKFKCQEAADYLCDGDECSAKMRKKIISCSKA